MTGPSGRSGRPRARFDLEAALENAVTAVSAVVDEMERQPLGAGDRAAAIRSRSLLVCVSRLLAQVSAVLAPVRVSVYAAMPVESEVVKARRVKVNAGLEDSLLLVREARVVLAGVAEELGMIVRD